jgi:hypothetical protein
MLIIKNFDQLPKKAFDQTPNLTENFDQLKMSSEIRSSDHSPFATILVATPKHFGGTPTIYRLG